MNTKYSNVEGKKFGRLRIIKKIGNNKWNSGIYECLCDCGKVKNISLYSLTRGLSKSCGCLQKEMVKKSGHLRIKKLEGKTFGYLYVIKQIGRKNGEVLYQCRCKCGKIKEIVGGTLSYGSTKSCGCLRSETIRKVCKKDFTGMTFGYLKVKKYTGMRNRQSFYECECSRDGNIVNITGSSLMSGRTKSCGCLNSESYVAKELKKYFKENYNSKEEYREFRNPKTNYFLPYDIYLIDYKCYIEINGIQHYEHHKRFHKTNKDFEYQKEKDKMKKKHARKNGIYIEIDLRKYLEPIDAIKFIENRINGEK